MSHRHLRHRRTRHAAFGQYLALQLNVVAATAAALGLFHGAHLNLWWTPSSLTTSAFSRRVRRTLTSDAQRLKALEAENGKLKRLLANSMLEVDAMREVLQRK
jgi:hypothetical protein